MDIIDLNDSLIAISALARAALNASTELVGESTHTSVGRNSRNARRTQRADHEGSARSAPHSSNPRLREGSSSLTSILALTSAAGQSLQRQQQKVRLQRPVRATVRAAAHISRAQQPQTNTAELSTITSLVKELTSIVIMQRDSLSAAVAARCAAEARMVRCLRLLTAPPTAPCAALHTGARAKQSRQSPPKAS